MERESKRKQSREPERAPEAEAPDLRSREGEERRDLPPRQREAEKVKGGIVAPCDRSQR